MSQINLTQEEMTWTIHVNHVLKFKTLAEEIGKKAEEARLAEQPELAELDQEWDALEEADAAAELALKGAEETLLPARALLASDAAEVKDLETARDELKEGRFRDEIRNNSDRLNELIAKVELATVVAKTARQEEQKTRTEKVKDLTTRAGEAQQGAGGMQGLQVLDPQNALCTELTQKQQELTTALGSTDLSIDAAAHAAFVEAAKTAETAIGALNTCVEKVKKAIIEKTTSCHDTIVDGHKEANAKLVKVCQDLATFPSGPDHELESKVGKVAFEVEREFPGLKGEAYTAQQAKTFAKVRDRAQLGLKALDELVVEAEKKLKAKHDALATAKKDIEEFEVKKTKEIDKKQEGVNTKKVALEECKRKIMKLGVKGAINAELWEAYRKNPQYTNCQAILNLKPEYEQLVKELKVLEDGLNEAKTQLEKDLASKNDELEKMKRTQTIEWSDPVEIVYSTKLELGVQLNARLTVGDGTLEYSNASGERVEGTIPDADDGGQVLKVAATGTDTFKASAPKEVKIHVSKADLVINWDDPAEIKYGTKLSKTELGATVVTTPPMPERYEELAKKIKYFDAGKAVTAGMVLDAEEHALTAQMPPDNNFNPIVVKPVQLKVQPAKQVIAWDNPSPLEITYGTALVAGQLNAAVSTDPPLTDRYETLTNALKYTDAEGHEVKVGSKLKADTHTLTVNTADVKNFTAAAPKTATIKVKKATRTINAGALESIEETVTEADMNRLNASVKLSAGTADDLELSVNGVKVVKDAKLKLGAGQKLKIVVKPSENFEDTLPEEKDIAVLTTEEKCTEKRTAVKLDYDTAQTSVATGGQKNALKKIFDEVEELIKQKKLAEALKKLDELKGKIKQVNDATARRTDEDKFPSIVPGAPGNGMEKLGDAKDLLAEGGMKAVDVMKIIPKGTTNSWGGNPTRFKNGFQYEWIKDGNSYHIHGHSKDHNHTDGNSGTGAVVRISINGLWLKSDGTTTPINTSDEAHIPLF